MPQCSPPELAAVLNLVGPGATATDICRDVDVSALGPQAAVIRYLAKQQSQQQVESGNGTDILFILFSAYLVFMMQVGFAMLCAGHVRVKNNLNILLKNVMDTTIGTLAWFLLGNAFAFGELNGYANPFIGAGDFALANTNGDTNGNHSYHMFLFHWAFSAAAATIAAGAVAERISLTCYMCYTCLMSGFVYPVVTHWFWTRFGWLSPMNASPLFGSGAMDFAGGAVVHTLGGVASLLGVWFCGPRIGRFSINGEVNPEFRENNGNMLVLGTLLLWFGWYGFNPGSAAAIANYKSASLVSRTAVTTTLGAGAGGLWLLLLTFAVRRSWDVMQMCNGVLCGLVAVTPGCGLIDPWAALPLAVLGSSLFWLLDTAMLRIQLDDVVAAVPLHLGCGVLGMLGVGFFARQEFVEQAYGISTTGSRRWGVLFGGDGRMLAAQIVSVLVTAAWVCLLLIPFFWIMRTVGLVRVSMEQELAGLDASRYTIVTTNELPTMQDRPKSSSGERDPCRLHV